MRAIYVAALGVLVSVATIVVFGQNWAKADATRPGPPPEGLWVGQPSLPMTDRVRTNSTSSMRHLNDRRYRAGRESAQYDDTPDHHGKCLRRRHAKKKSSSWCARCRPMHRSRLVIRRSGTDRLAKNRPNAL